MTSLSDTQKQIYNLYLRALRTNNNKPYRAKKDFSDIEKDEEKLQQLKKIESIFLNYPAFYSNSYFDAPYKIYPDDKKFFSLKFYSSYKGITTCTAYFKTLTKSKPEEQFNFLKESYKFIAKFCIEKKIKLQDYVDYCSISQNDCLIHLKQHKISWYVVFSIPRFYDLLHNLPNDEFELYYGSDVDLNHIMNLYQSSIKTQEFLKDVRKKISFYINKKLATTSEV